jgi:glycosyltransferase involved in cell wall biosynthesis
MEQTQTPHATVVIATLNEEEGVGLTIEEIKKFLGNPQILVVDGWSHDRTVEIAKNMGAEILFQEGIGKGNALGHGIQQLGSNVRYVVFTDADFTYPAEYVPKMIEILEHNPDVGMVIGNRFSKEFSFKDASNSAFYAGNRLLAFAQHIVNGIKLTDPLSGLRVVRYEILKDWRPKSEGFDVEAEMNYCVERLGYKTAEIPIQYRPRLGEKKLKLRHGLTILKRIVSESFVEHNYSAFYS